MTFIIYSLTVLFAIACFGIIKKKRYKVMPFICLGILICFVGLGTISVLSLILPNGEIVFYPLGTILLGLISILAGLNDIHALRCCKEKVDGVYCGYNTYYGGNAVSTQSPVFEYTYNGTRYREQTTQNVSYRQLNQRMAQGNVYSLYVDPKHPAVYILTRKMKAGTIIIIGMGLFFLTFGIALSFALCPVFLA